jgi:hypothetical protein
MNDDIKNNLVFNIINNSKPNILFNYSIIIVALVLIFNSINLYQNATIGIFVSLTVIYYFYTFRSINDISTEKKINEKYDLINTRSSVLEKHIKFTNILFYMDDFKYLNIPLFNILTSQIESFCNTFESCMTNFKLIDTMYSTLIQLKLNIMASINNLSFLSGNFVMQEKINRIRNELENVLNKYLKIIVGNYKKNIYYNGYNKNSKLIDDSNVLALNSFEVHDYKINNFNYSNLQFIT